MTHLANMQLAQGRASKAHTVIPTWVPEEVQRYLTHTEQGLTIRELARRSGCHASTVMRQIRKIEVRRDDPLIDRALHALSSSFFHSSLTSSAKETAHMKDMDSPSITPIESPDLERQTLRILNRLCETGAVLAVAEGMETAVVVRESADGATNKTASVSAEFVSVLALNEWVDCPEPARISRYKITAAGRNKLAQLAAIYVKEDSTNDEDSVQDAHSTKKRRIRYTVVDSPVTALSRRKGKDGAPFLNDDLVNAAERLREDFELAQMGPGLAQNWDSFLTAGSGSQGSACAGDRHLAPRDARERVGKALSYLGPGLGDVALHCCCHLEGLENTEKRMGWSARSGKIVLRIALQRLCGFYETELGDVLIG